MEKTIIGVVIGSLRRESFNKKVARSLMEMMPDSFEMRILEIGNLPIYNQDLDDDDQVPKEWADFRRQVKEVDGLLFVTPEYNRSVPPVLKNALDVASRPYGQNMWNAKPGAIVSVSTGSQGGFGANHILRQSMTFLNVYTMQQPEVYIGGASKLFDDSGVLTNEGTKKFLQSVAEAYAAWVGRFVKK